jgi:predicted phosphodiesterase
MLRRTLLLALTLCGAARGQAPTQAPADYFFIQLADPQFGAFTGDRDFAQETANYEFAVANVNRLKPKFVVICGDLINKVGDPVQSAEYKRITALIGNHDVGNEPTLETLRDYREHFGPDYYSFRQGEIYGIVLNSSMISAPSKVQAEADKQEGWLKTELAKAKASGAQHIVVFQHHSWFLEQPDEASQYFNIPIEQRKRYLAMIKDAGVRYVFAGHYHRNALGKDGELEMITNGPVGRPMGNDPSGIRIVTVRGDKLEHGYFGMGQIPNQYPQPQRGR